MKKIFVALTAFALMTTAAFAATKQIDVSVKGMMCSSCAKKMQSKFKAQGGVQNVSVDLKKGLVHVSMQDGKDITDDQIKTLINSTEYSVAQIQRH